MTGALEGGPGILRCAVRSYGRLECGHTHFRPNSRAVQYLVIQRPVIRDMTYTENANNVVVRTARFSMGQSNVEEQPYAGHLEVVRLLRIAQVDSVQAAVNGNEVEQTFVCCRADRLKRYLENAWTPYESKKALESAYV
ncbi:hypothetical protein BU15DRAFT_66977 [Melanogaster broomeanus]|nr:hypothetical protein BU15DRAFT_66977 [Melanogaster broomeanus]